MQTFRLAHLSDLHLQPPARARSYAPKRVLSEASWRRRRSATHRPEALAAIVADVTAQKPDHIAITGDLTNFSAPEEIAAAGRWLEALAPADALTVSPGNHDALVGAAGADRFRAWAPWLGDAGEARFPQVRERGRVAIVNLCSAVPTAPLLAQGSLGREQLAELADLLSGLGRRRLHRVVLLHHPPVRGVVPKRKSLTDDDAFRQVLHTAGAELVLHGHAHEAVVSATTGPRGPIPVLGVPSASAAPDGHAQPARWHLIEIDEQSEGFAARVISRGFGEGGKVEELGRYALASAQG